MFVPNEMRHKLVLKTEYAANEPAGAIRLHLIVCIVLLLMLQFDMHCKKLFYVSVIIH